MASGFSSDGFDLDAAPSATSGDEDVIYELGGGATVASVDGGSEEGKIALSEDWKVQGNEEFKNKNYLEAYDMYTSAIEACPGMRGDEILKLRDEFDKEETTKLYEQSRLEGETPTQQAKSEFRAPTHPHGKNLAIYHCNRAACELNLGRYEDGLRDSDIATLLRPEWPKAYLRRSLAFENLGKTEEALKDAKKALELDPTNSSIRKLVIRLQKIEDERIEKLKEETIGKLKDLGNSVLSNFGLSLDNFKAQQDPKTGSYSISFDQNASKS